MFDTDSDCDSDSEGKAMRLRRTLAVSRGVSENSKFEIRNFEGGLV